MGHFTHDFTLVIIPLSAWGVATGIGLKRAWRWAWFSMLIFGGLLTASCTVLIVPLLLMPGGEVEWRNVLATRLLGVLLFLTPVAIGVRWIRFFMQDNVRTYFKPSPKNPAAFA